MAIRPDGANNADGTGSSSVSGRLSRLAGPRIAPSAASTPAITTTTTAAANAMDRLPWMKVLRMTWSS